MEEQVKECSKCHKILSFDNFRWKNKSQNKKHSWCKNCEKEADKKHYQESIDRRLHVRATANFQKQRNAYMIIQAKEKGCQKCGEKRQYVLDFHHLDPSIKIDTIAHMLKSSSAEALEQEINKCILLCANCHREFHYLEELNHITIDEYLNLKS